MSKKKDNEQPIVDDELLETSGAEPAEHTLGDAIEEELEALRDSDDAPDGEATTDAASTIARLEDQIAEKDDRHLRLYAEFENYKRRSQREKLDLMETAGRKTMLALLPVLDDLARAQQQAATTSEGQEQWDGGVGLIVKKLLKTLEGQGLKPMESTGEAFNADLHEAITEVPNPEMAGKVVDTVERGYLLNGKIIRHAKVVVGK
ncbi:nucleotide exchange factor GrpE [Neolewinella lacunae]|uniref:Protein GrpE n=1 Tax=Neolewinella lacunae TaxID=1517758 RepID=A0A923PH56_9BACT|nr:nucleotide exchange factor GrpE [Neolewinella lacunae]MBC6993194.1 nucleotide exchange factor GrpE [Neolewinella lacunae]MDN3637113.1 nucleotide exchange factor GrpE [Neolewinella lacunae]